MIKAKITVFDDETGVVYDHDQIIDAHEEVWGPLGIGYIFLFRFNLADPEKCLEALRRDEVLRKRKVDENDERGKARTGVWIYSSFFGGCYRCSICGHEQASKTALCPKCRTKMEREDDPDARD